MPIRKGRKSSRHFKHLKGFVACTDSLLNLPVIVLDAEKAGYNPKMKYVALCVPHGDWKYYPNIREVKNEINYPDFCKTCAKSLPDVPTFYKRIRVFIRKAQRMIDRNTKRGKPRTLDYCGGPKRIRVFFTDTGRFVKPWVFIDRINGDCLRPMTQGNPCLGARANLFNADYGVPKTPAGFPKHNSWVNRNRKRKTK